MWYYRLFGEEFGPVPHEMLVTLLENGTLSDTDEVKAEAGVHWIPLKEVFQAPQEETLQDAGRETLSNLGEAQNGWFCKVLGRDLGPMPFEEIQSFVEDGQLSADDEVKLGAAGKWRTVRSIGRLMAVLPFEKKELKIPDGKSSREFEALEAPETTRRSKSSKSRYDDEEDDEEEDEEEELRQRSRKKKKRRRYEEYDDEPEGAYGRPAYGTAAPYGQSGYGYQNPGTPAYGMPAMGAGWGQAPVDHLWYAWIGGQEYGPADFAQLTQWGTNGQLSATDYVRQGTTGQYVLASTIAGLLPAVVAKPVVQAPAAPPAPAAPVPAAAVQAPAAQAPAAAKAVATKVEPARTEEKPKTAATDSHLTDTARLSKSDVTVALPKTSSTSEASKPAATASSAVASASVTEVSRAVKDEPQSSAPSEQPAPAPIAASAPSYGGASGGYSSSGFGGGSSASRPSPSKALPKKKAPSETPEWLKESIESIKSPKGLAAVGLLLLVGLFFGWGYLPGSSGADRAVQGKLEELLITVEKLRDTKAAPSEWDALAQKAKTDFPPTFVSQLNSTATSKYPHRKYHLWCIRDRLPSMLTKSRTKISSEEMDFKNNLWAAAQILKYPTKLSPPPEVASAGKAQGEDNQQ